MSSSDRTQLPFDRRTCWPGADLPASKMRLSPGIGGGFGGKLASVSRLRVRRRGSRAGLSR
jgi:hypothetical protein